MRKLILGWLFVGVALAQVTSIPFPTGGGGGSSNFTATSGAANPSAACTAPSGSTIKFYYQSTTKQLWYCKATDTWDLLPGVDSTVSGALILSGITSGAKGFGVLDIAGSAILYILPVANGVANQVMYDTGTVTCPTLDPSAPATCHQLAWRTNAIEPIVNKTADYTITATDFVNHQTFVTPSGAPFTLTLPAVAPTNGDYIDIVNYDASGSNITVARNSLTINGAASDYPLLSATGSVFKPYSVRIRSNGSNYIAEAHVASPDINCTNQFIRATGASQPSTCASIVAADLSAALITPVKMAASTVDTQSDGATITWAIASIKDAFASVTLGGNRTLNITNPVVGGNYVFYITQDGTGSRTLTKGSGCTFKELGSNAATFGLSTTAGAVDMLTFTYHSNGNCYANVGKDYK